MTTNVRLSDALLRQALLELAAGPDATALLTDVLRGTETRQQARRWGWPVVADHRRLTMVGVAALLAAALVGSLIASGRIRTGPVRPFEMVVQQWNRLAEPDSRVTHSAWAPGAAQGTVLSTLPDNAINPRWSPDGERVVYVTTEITVRDGGLSPGPRMSPAAMYVADTDGNNAVEVALARSIADYPTHTWFAGPLWAPDSRRFALPWSPNGCEGIDCVPPAGIDIFDRGGRLITSIDTPSNINIAGFWSADGQRIGWTTGTCIDSNCMDDAVHWRAVDGDPTITSFAMTLGGLVWTADGRLHGTTFDADGATGVVTMAPDGTDVRDVPWALDPNMGAAWSPDGRWLASVDYAAGRLVLRDVIAGVDSSWPIPADLGFAAWSPDSMSIAMAGESSAPETAGYGLWLVAIETGEVVSVGDADDFGWLPGGVLR